MSMQITLGKFGITCKLDEQLVVHSKNVAKADVVVEDETWDKLVKTIIWRNGDIKIEQKLDEDTVVIPWEVLSLTGQLLVGICGTGDGGEVVRPTTWGNVGTVVQGVLDGAQAFEPTDVTPTVYDALLSDLADVKSAMAKNAEKYSGAVIVYQAGDGIRIDGGHVISAEVTLGALDTKASTQHTHVISDVAELNERLDAKADKAHVHAVEDVEGLETRMQALEQATIIRKKWDDPCDGASGVAMLTRIGDVATLSFWLQADTMNIDTRFNHLDELRELAPIPSILSGELINMTHPNDSSIFVTYVEDGGRASMRIVGDNLEGTSSAYVGHLTWVCDGEDINAYI